MKVTMLLAGLAMVLCVGCDNQNVTVTLPECKFGKKMNEKDPSTFITEVEVVPCLGYSNGKRIGASAQDLEVDGLKVHRAMLTIDQTGSFRSIEVH